MKYPRYISSAGIIYIPHCVCKQTGFIEFFPDPTKNKYNDINDSVSFIIREDILDALSDKDWIKYKGFIAIWNKRKE